MSFWNFVPSIIEAGVGLWGAKQQSKANNAATQEMVNAQNRATEAQREGIQAAQRIFEQQQRAAAPGLTRAYEMMGRSDELTDVQRRAIEDGMRGSVDMMRSGSTGGSARTVSAIMDDVQGRMTERFLDQNRQRGDSVASGLTSQYFGQGTQSALSNRDMGDAIARGLISAAEPTANNIVGQNNIKTSAVGNIAGVIAESVKAANNEKRASSYDPITWNSGRIGAV